MGPTDVAGYHLPSLRTQLSRQSGGFILVAERRHAKALGVRPRCTQQRVHRAAERQHEFAEIRLASVGLRHFVFVNFSIRLWKNHSLAHRACIGACIAELVLLAFSTPLELLG